MLQWLLFGAAIASILFFNGYTFIKQSTHDISALIFTLFLTGVSLSPVVIWSILIFSISSILGRYVWLIGGLFLFGFASVAYYQVLVAHYDDALNGLALFFLPLYQDAMLAALFGIIYFAEWLQRKRA
ncbi:MAG TPA: hypothetical protein VIK59_01340 [Verrucomicrobiae bacterium]